MQYLPTYSLRWFAILGLLFAATIAGAKQFRIQQPGGAFGGFNAIEVPPVMPQQPAAGGESDPRDEAQRWMLPPLPPLPEQVRLEMTDGSVVVGTMETDMITVETEFGKLEIPVSRIRRFIPGLGSRTELSEKIGGLVAQLSDEDIKKRDAGQAALTTMGIPVREELRRRLENANPEQSRRLKEIVGKLDEMALDAVDADSGIHVWRQDDLIETADFTVAGRIIQDHFEIASRYGKLKLAVGEIRNARRDIHFAAPDVNRRLSVEGQYLALLRYKSSGIRVSRGDRIIVRAEGQIQMSPWGSNVTSTPDGGSNFGQCSFGSTVVEGGALVGRIGDRGDVIKIGSKASFVAKRAGLLEFGIAMRNDFSQGNYAFPGQYNLKITVERSGN